MVLVVGILLSILIGYAYMRKGLFAGALLLVSVVLAAVTSLAFAAAVADMTQYLSKSTYAYTIAGLFIMSVGILRGCLAFMDEDVDFHPALEHLGGAACGLASGLLCCGVLSVCLSCMPTPDLLQSSKDSIVQSTQLVLKPWRLIQKVVGRDRQPMSVDNLLAAAGQQFSNYQPPPPPKADKPVEPGPDADPTPPPPPAREEPPAHRRGR